MKKNAKAASGASASRGAAGFTLPEVMTAMVVMVIVIGGIAAIYMASMRMWYRGAAETYAQQGASWAVQRIVPEVREGLSVTTAGSPYESVCIVVRLPNKVYDSGTDTYLNEVAAKEGIKTLAILYSTNDFTGTQAKALRGFIEKAGKIKIVYDQGVPTSTSNYTVLINNIAAHKPDAVAELGYPGNDIAFLRNLQDSGEQFRFLFSIYAGEEFDLLKKNVGADGLKNVFTYVPPANYTYKVNYGMNLAQYKAAWDKKYPAGSGVEFGANAIYGYDTGLVIERALATAKGLSQMDIHDAVFALSGKLKTLDGPFVLNSEGAQIGVITPLGQVQADGKDVKLMSVYPPQFANAKAVLGK